MVTASSICKARRRSSNRAWREPLDLAKPSEFGSPERPLRSSMEVADGDEIEVHELMSAPFRSSRLCSVGVRRAAIGETVPEEGTGLVSALLSARA